MDYTQVDIYTTTEGIEPVGAALIDIGAGGFAIQDAADFEDFLAGKNGRWDYIDEELMKLRDAETTLTVYLAQGEQGVQMLAAVREALARLKSMDTDGVWGRLTCELKNVREEDWATAWKQYYKPQKVGERLVVCPSWEEYTPQPDEVVVTLDPGMAFGTGTHDSTRLCLQFVEQYVKSGRDVLDVGCGSGILAVASLLLGAGNAIGVDIDEVAVRSSEENAELNGVRERSSFHCGNLADKVSGTFSLICLNIVADVIIGFAPEIPAYLEPDGVLLTSGIIDTREGDVRAALDAAGLEVIDAKASGGWVALAAKKR